jgi:glycyl-tRNA synthetase beta chain
MTIETLLVELITEELPPKALRKLGEAFATEIFQGLSSNDFLEADAKKTVFATPRRLAVQITNVRDISLPKQVRSKLMPLAVALDAAGKPTPALKKKLQSLGYKGDADFDAIVLERVSREQDGKNEVLIHTEMAAGIALAIRLQGAIEQAIAKLPIPKVMSYQLADGETTVQFVRPVHRLVAMHGSNVLTINALGLTASNVTAGHRFQGKKVITLGTASEYEAKLESPGNVIAGFDKRRVEIDRQLRAQAGKQQATLESGDAYNALLDEVTALVEYPTVYVGQFDPVFLEVPQECLILTMRANQKYFPLHDGEGKLTNKFLIVSNMRLDDATNITTGNERVIRPRLADARFFYDQDRKHTLESRLPKLANVVYHNKLGSQGERGGRVAAIARGVAKLIGVPVEQAARAAQLAKSDLVSDMVSEFPELQGTMGRYYALHDGESADVADAIEDHYKPRFAGDTLPRGKVGNAVSLADKLETLTGLFGIGQTPTGDKDPFALRRHALGIVRIIVEQDLAVSLSDLLRVAFDAFQGKIGDAHAELESFIFQRLEGYLREQGYGANEVDAVLSQRPMLLYLVPRQLAAVRAFMQMPEAESLAAANKRVANILKKAEQNGGVPGNAEEGQLVEAAERRLFAALKTATPGASKLYQAQDFTGYLKSFAVLKAPVDDFFDNVMVMADDPKLRDNRLALLHDLRSAMNRIADISKLAS